MPQLREREQVLDAILAPVARAKARHGSTTFVVGEAGLGKTSVVRVVAEQAGLRAGLGEAVASESVLPFGVVTQALAGFEGFDQLGAVEGLASLESRAAFYHRTARWLAELTAVEPVLILLDDLHWADPDSLGLLAFLCRRATDWGLAVVAALRPWPPTSMAVATDLVAAGLARIERLQPLGAAAAAAVVEEAAGRGLSADERAEAVEGCGGNPFLLTQRGMVLRTPAHRASAGTGAAGLLVHRFGDLPAEVLRMAQAASVLGPRFRLPHAAAVAGEDLAAVGQAVAVLVSAGLLRARPDGQFEFLHPLVCQALYDELPEPIRQGWHGRAMRALARTEPAKAARHARSGHLVGDAQAVTVSEVAGREALAAGGVESALVHFRSAAELAGAAASPELLLGLAETGIATGHTEEVEAIGNRILAVGPTPPVRARALTLLARASVASGRPDRAEWRFDAAAEAVRGYPEQEAMVLIEAVATCSVLSPPARLRAWAERVRSLPMPGGATRRTAVETAWAVAAGMTGEPAGVTAAFDALADGRFEAVFAFESPTLAAWTAVGAIHLALMSERFALADRAFEIAWPRAQRLGSPLLMTVLALSQADVESRRGRLSEVRRLTRLVEEINVGLPAGHSGIGALPRAYLALEAGDPAAVLTECDRLGRSLLDDVPDHHPVHRIWRWKLQAEVALDAGQVKEAAALARQMEALAGRAGIAQPNVVPWADTAIAAYLRHGELDRVIGVADRLESAASAWDCRWPGSVAAGGRAGVAEARGMMTEAEAHHQVAVGVLDRSDLSVARVRALIDQGVFLRRAGQPARSRGPLARALEEAEVCGSARLAARAEAELRASGGRRRRGHHGGLSAQEHRVAVLARRGATNAEIAAALTVSTRTVEHHLGMVYAKLGIHSRQDLPADIADR